MTAEATDSGAEPTAPSRHTHDWAALASRIRAWGRELGFQAVGIADTDLSLAEPGLAAWLAAGYGGEMDYMARHGSKRSRPAELHAGTLRIITARMNYWPMSSGPHVGAAEASADHHADYRANHRDDPLTNATVGATARSTTGQTGNVPRTAEEVLAAPERGYVSRYAVGRDYHKVLRARLKALAERIAAEAGPHGYRVFTDSAPVLEVELAKKSGLGWRGKHTLLLSRDAGSAFFLGEIYTDLPLPPDAAVEEHCGTCSRCIAACPTGAIVAPYRLDARRCISYLTIELKGSIPEDLRPLMGNRVYGCDDCQLVCPWNSFARATDELDFRVRHGLDNAQLIELFSWSEAEFNQRMAGSAILRIGHERWLRNVAVAMGNALAKLSGAPPSEEIRAALEARRDHPSALVREHVRWALGRDGVAR